MINNADKLAGELAHTSAVAGVEICEVLGRKHLPRGADEDSVFVLILSLRAAIDLKGARKKYGKTASAALRNAMLRLYTAEINPAFGVLLASAESTIEQACDPREWVRLHSMKCLQTRDPQHEFFHLCLMSGFRFEPIAAIVERMA